jgi:hypothetical protein
MVIAALVSFVILLVAWILAPSEAAAQAAQQPIAVEPDPEQMPVAA